MAGKTKVKTTGRQRSEFIWGWLFILPTVIGLIVLNIIPIFQTIYQSFFKTGDFGRGNIFVGLENYQKVFADKEIWQALLNTFKYAIVEVPFSIIIALVLAVFLNRTFCLSYHYLSTDGCSSGSSCHGLEMAV